MGGIGSTRWNHHTAKTVVEDCWPISITTFKAGIRHVEQHGGTWAGVLNWKRGARNTGSLGFEVFAENDVPAIRLQYQIGGWGDERTSVDYVIQLQSTPLSWGGVRWWFTCPLSIDGEPCQRRVGNLYRPPRQQIYGCRHCYNLTYRSSQESGKFARMYADLAHQMSETHPGISGEDVRRMLDGKEARGGLYSSPLYQKLLEDIAAAEQYDRYEKYLSRDELLEQSGLRPTSLAELDAARLLLPDTSDGRYRPKLVSWAKKLNHLIENGWQIGEISRWAKGRWKSRNPRRWPPNRTDWQ